MIRKKFKGLVALFLALAFCANLASCASNDTDETSASTNVPHPTMGTTQPTKSTIETDITDEEDAWSYPFELYIGKAGTPVNEDNEIKNLIAEMTCVSINENWSEDDEAGEDLLWRISREDVEHIDLVYSDEWYDFSSLTPWDEYIEKYPNIKALYTDEEWDMFRQFDGLIYWADVFGSVYGESKDTTHWDNAFWIQTRVLEWDNYPEIETLDEYFDLVDRYYKANSTMPDGTRIIPYTTLCEDWKFFCLEAVPGFLDGYMVSGCAISDEDPMNPKAVDYNNTPTAKAYFSKLNEEYLAGHLDSEFSTQTYEEYIEKLSSGRVLGMFDNYSDFSSQVDLAFSENGLDELGCNYIPLSLVIEEGVSSKYHPNFKSINPSAGVAVPLNCQNVELSFKVLDAMLSQKFMDLRFWGIEGVDYLVDENGIKYRTEEMREKWEDPDYKLSHCYEMEYLPHYRGTSTDEINAMLPAEQTSEFYATLPDPVMECLKAYRANNFVDMLSSDIKDYCPGDWYPLYEYDSEYPNGTNTIFIDINVCKREWIPKLVMSKNFEATWDEYMKAYDKCFPEIYISDMQKLIDSRMDK